MADKSASKRILSSAILALQESGIEKLTVESVAKKAGVAKGLVHYHYETKRGLLEAVLGELTDRRCADWSAAFEADSASAVVDGTWKLLTDESESGALQAWHSLVGLCEPLTDQATKSALERFSDSLGRAGVGMLDRNMSLGLTVKESEIGWLLAAVVCGMGVQLLGGGDPNELQGAYAAAWLGILSLTEARS